MSSLKSIIAVAIGVITQANNRVFIAKRPEKTVQSGLWEFPGGKIEEGESAYQALVRELEEELGIQTINANPWLSIPYRLSDKQDLHLHCFQVDSFTGTPYGKEGQITRWIDYADLTAYLFPKPNRLLIDELLKSR